MHDFIEFRKIIAIFPKWWWLLILAGVAGGMVGQIYSEMQTPVYQAATTLLVGRSIQSTTVDVRDISASEQLAQTYVNVVRLQPVLSTVIQNLKLEIPWQTLTDRVRASKIENTQLLKIFVEADSTNEAVAIANEIAKILILQSTTATQNPMLEENQGFAQQRLEQLKTNISQGQKRIDELEIMIPTAGSMEAVQQIQKDIDSYQTLVSGWENNYSRLLDLATQSASPGLLTIVESAQGSASPIRPLTTINILIASIVALALTFGITLLLEFLKLSPEDIEEMIDDLGMVSLGSVGTLKGKSLKERLIIKHNAFSSVSEDYRLLRSKVQYLAARCERKVLVITSNAAGGLQSVVTANLAIVLAQAGWRTIIIDTNIRHPSQHELFELSNRHGLADALTDLNEEYSEYLQETSVSNLHVLTTGSFPTLYPTELLGSPRMQNLLTHLAAQTDVILCDSAEAVHFADAIDLSNLADGVILVLDGNKNDRSATSQVVVNLSQVGANIVGVVTQTERASNLRSKMPVGNTSMHANETRFPQQKNINHAAALQNGSD